jgi:hypothetical protein
MNKILIMVAALAATPALADDIEAQRNLLSQEIADGKLCKEWIADVALPQSEFGGAYFYNFFRDCMGRLGHTLPDKDK